MKKSKKDNINIQNAYLRQVVEYEKMSLEDLKELYNKGKLSSTYKEALLNVVAQKLKKIKQETIESKIEEIKDEIVKNDIIK